MIRDSIKNILERFRHKREVKNEYELNQKVANTYEQKRLSHNERVLNRLLEENRQKKIKEELEYEIRKRKNEDSQIARNMFSSNRRLWSDNSLMKTPNVFKNQQSILKSRRLI